MTGQSAKLGSWNPHQGLYLSTNEQDFPLWKSDKIPVDELAVGLNNLKLEYKYVIVSSNSQEMSYNQDSMKWEEIEGNRNITLNFDNITSS